MAPMSFLTYEDVRPWARAMKQKVTLREMPPWYIDKNVGVHNFKNDVSLTDKEIATLAKWADTGAAKGNPAANIFLAKNLLGSRDYVSSELSGPDGGPIAIAPAPELGVLSDDEIKQLAILVGKAERPRKG